MTEISMAETVTIWKEGVCLLEQGNFQEAVMKFVALEERTDSSRLLITPGRNLFNIGQSYLALGELDRAAKVCTSYQSFIGCVFTSTIVSLNIPEGVLFTDFVKRLKNDWCFHV